MADLAFILLIFFTINIIPRNETGLLFLLRHWSNELPNEFKVQQRNVLSINLGLENELLVRGETYPFEKLKDKVIEFVINSDNSSELALTPRNAVISLSCDYNSQYGDYVAILDAIKSAYKDMWEKEALRQFGIRYRNLSKENKQKIRNVIPFSLLEAESTSCGF